MFVNVLRLEIDRFFKQRLFWLELLFVTFLFVFIALLLYAARSAFPGLVNAFGWPLGLFVSLNSITATSLGGLLLVALAGWITTQEYSWHTMQLWLSHGIPRLWLLCTKVLVLFMAAILMGLVILLVGGGLSLLLSLSIHGSVNIAQVKFVELLLSVVRAVYSVFPYIALTFMLGIITRSPWITICGSLLFAGLLEGLLARGLSLLGGIWGQVALYLPASLTTAMVDQNVSLLNVPLNVTHDVTLSAGQAAIGIALYTLIFCGIAGWCLQRQNLHS
ncbi:hypothetical protein EPA93_26415 [Ktedonosporobacter rubrisoli]|uniref:Uncharacterized protein n=1 Tax=Ktedonosporobacter rubrisoli TaxID=2509675 RepID=A0A4V0YZD4_KTERU|nr:ABC transporter permease subunit [Ktedonosporobacter rubrisoli]QBD79331.1 hypothetical protein EPA93_26415 [Ktedonosporobacter rubrisoli]